MSSGESGRTGLAQIPEALRAVLTPVQQFLLLDTVLVVSVGDLRRALCDAAFAERLVRRPEPSPPAQQRAFTLRPASEAELAAVQHSTMLAIDAAARPVAEAAPSVIERLRQAAEARRISEERHRQRATAAAERRAQQAAEATSRRQQQNATSQPAANRQRPPNRQQSNARQAAGFDAALRNMSQSARHQPGHVPVLSGQSDAREESLAQARANRVPVDWDSDTMWRLRRSPHSVVMIADLSNAQLVNEIDVTLSQVARLFQLYAEGVWLHNDNHSPLRRAKQWLALQPAFRALVQEAIRKDVGLSPGASLYIRQFVLGAGRPAAAVLAAEQAPLADFVNHPVRVVTEESVVDTFGRSGRALRLDDD